MWEVIIILVVALIILGPRQLAEAARVIGKLYREIQKLTWEVRDSIDLDSLTSPDTEKKSPQGSEEAQDRFDSDQELIPPPGEKSGPDFYADLLEESKEADEKEEAAHAESPPKEEERSGKEHEPSEEKRS